MIILNDSDGSTREYLWGKYHCTVDLLFDRFGLACFANKNKNCQLSYSWFQTSQTGGQQYSDTSPFSIPWQYYECSPGAIITPLVIRMAIICDATTWTVTYDHHSDNSKSVIHDRNIFVTKLTVLSVSQVRFKSYPQKKLEMFAKVKS